MSPLIHHLTHPGDLTASAVVCGDAAATVATWQAQQVTCLTCRSRAAERPLPLGRGGGMSEKALQAAVTAALTRTGWLWYHTLDSRKSPAGFPDLLCLRSQPDGSTRCLVIELKSATGLLTPAQTAWLEAWRRLVGTEVHVWRPANLETALEVFR